MSYEMIRKLDGFTGDARLYKLATPVDYQGRTTEYVIASATVVPFGGPETYIFAADKDGNILNWLELPGSYKGGLDHEEAMRGLRGS
jgi:hypothetical protein